MEKQLFRSKQNKVVAGVCGGFAEYFNIDPTLVRLIWIAVSFTFGAGIIAYIIAAIIMPERTKYSSNNSDFAQDNDTSSDTFNPGTDDWGKPGRYDYQKNRKLVGGILVLLGGLFLVREFLSWFQFKYFWPVIFIAVGILIIVKSRRNSV